MGATIYGLEKYEIFIALNSVEKGGRYIHTLLPGASFVWRCSQTGVGSSSGEYYSEDAIETGYLAGCIDVTIETGVYYSLFYIISHK